MLRKGATFTLPQRADTQTLCKVRRLNTTRFRCGDFSPDTCCLTLQLKVPAITLQRKSARRNIVHLILV